MVRRAREVTKQGRISLTTRTELIQAISTRRCCDGSDGFGQQAQLELHVALLDHAAEEAGRIDPYLRPVDGGAVAAHFAAAVRARWGDGDAVLTISHYLALSTQAASVLASASLSAACAGIGTGPHLPDPPLRMLSVIRATASF